MPYGSKPSICNVIEYITLLHASPIFVTELHKKPRNHQAKWFPYTKALNNINAIESQIFHHSNIYIYESNMPIN